MATIFEKIASGEIPGEILHRDSHCFVLRDVEPRAPVHLLIVPLEPIRGLSAAGEGDRWLLGHLLLVAKKMAEKFAPGGFRVVVNDGKSAGQSVPHLHVHLLAGRDFSWPPG
ncbi:MAG: HIT domain-containing protein [Puniceicoccales bacterium]|jgi:histidine triad (HIT) family protein|nr:HIT domain-containing protein [Puniceicoccales bacterium]